MRGRLNFRLCSRCWASDQSSLHCFLFFFNDTATTEIYTLSLHDALPISQRFEEGGWIAILRLEQPAMHQLARATLTRGRSEEHTSELQSQSNLVCRLLLEKKKTALLYTVSTMTTMYLPSTGTLLSAHIIA